jgi:hypothetical protein
MTHRPDGWQGTWNSSDITLEVESMFTTSLHISDFVQTQNKAKILTLKTSHKSLINIRIIILEVQIFLPSCINIYMIVVITTISNCNQVSTCLQYYNEVLIYLKIYNITIWCNDRSICIIINSSICIVSIIDAVMKNKVTSNLTVCVCNV